MYLMNISPVAGFPFNNTNQVPFNYERFQTVNCYTDFRSMIPHSTNKISNTGSQ